MSLNSVAHKIIRAGSFLRKVSVYASLNPARIARFTWNSFMYRKIFPKFTWRKRG